MYFVGVVIRSRSKPNNLAASNINDAVDVALLQILNNISIDVSRVVRHSKMVHGVSASVLGKSRWW